MNDKLSRRQVAQLGGFAAARNAGTDGMARKGHKGGTTTLEKRGREHFIRAAHKRWGRLRDANTARRTAATQQEACGGDAASGA